MQVKLNMLLNAEIEYIQSHTKLRPSKVIGPKPIEKLLRIYHKKTTQEGGWTHRLPLKMERQTLLLAS